MKRVKRTLVAAGPVALSLLLSFSFVTKAYAATPGSVSSWTPGSSLPIGETYSGHAVYNDYAYIVGGMNSSFSNSQETYYAHLNSDGSMGNWQTATHNLPNGVQGDGAVANNGYLYVIGGYTNTYSDLVYYAPLAADGSVGNWTQALSLPHGIMDAAVTVNNNYVYVLGGSDGFSDQEKVYYAPLNADGSVGNWVTSGDLPLGVRAPAAVVHNNYLYLSGGVSSGNATDLVRYAHLNSDGSVGAWTISSNHMPYVTSRQGNVVYHGYIFSFGGTGGGGETSGVYSAPLHADGTTGAWLTSPNSLPQSEYGAAGIEHNGYIYMAGGVNNNNILSATNYAQLAGYAVPVISNMSVSVVSGTSITVDVLAGATGNPDPSTLRIVSGPAHGTAVDPPETITYTPNVGYVGADSLVYEVCSLDDSSVCAQATLSFTVTAAVKAPDTGYGTPETIRNTKVALFGLAGLTSIAVGVVIVRRYPE